MRRPRAVIAIGLALVAIVVVGIAVASGGGDDDQPTTSPAPLEAPNETVTPPSAGALPAQLLECFADKGFAIESPAEIHSAPPQVVQECFGALHEGGGAP